MDSLASYVATTIRQLEYIQTELSDPAINPTTGLSVPKLSLPEVRQLKAAVDQVRIFLWAYLDSFSDGDLHAKLRTIRIGSAADMLGLLEQDFRSLGMPQSVDAQRLCQRVNAMADTVATIARQCSKAGAS